ncbi:hypothetical protein CW705_02055 [Candidatus Bathyarchaeota archaeon]|nr:MAG: hypothetical protein CW705_02055 [Candidatus Bathyarchaeota archaeon]
MSKKIRRKDSNPSESISIRKIYAKVASFRPQRSVIAIMLVAISIFLLGGGIYDIFMEPLPVLPVGGGRFLSYIPYRINEQLLVGSIGVMILYALGFLGLILIYHSIRYMHNRRHALIMVGIGATLLIIAFTMIESILFWIMHY